jgi:outer membrane autotransporter protein
LSSLAWSVSRSAALASAALALASAAAAQSPCEPSKPDSAATLTTAVTRLDQPPPDQTPPDKPPADEVPDQGDRRGEACRNIQTAPKVVAVMPGVTVVAATSFVGAITARLDSARGHGAATDNTAATPSDGMMGLGARRKAQAPPPGPASPFTVYAMGSLLGGNRTEAPGVLGFDYGSGSATMGLEYSLNRNLILGLAVNYTESNADVDGGATVDMSAIQGAAYLSYATRHSFLDLLAAFGTHELDLARPGLPAPIHGSTGGTAFALATRAGYLLELGAVRAGPIAGLTWVRSHIDGYTETGDPNLTLTVSSLTLDSVTGSVGIRFLAPFRAGGNLVVSYLNVTLEHQFGDLDHVLVANLASAPALPPILSAFAAFDARDYGKIEGGLTLELGPELSTSLGGASTFGRGDSTDFRLSAGLNWRF